MSANGLAGEAARHGLGAAALGSNALPRNDDRARVQRVVGVYRQSPAPPSLCRAVRCPRAIPRRAALAKCGGAEALLRRALGLTQPKRIDVSRGRLIERHDLNRGEYRHDLLSLLAHIGLNVRHHVDSK
jgi:hypothetical protein